MNTLAEKILDDCAQRGICPLNRIQFDEIFTGRDLTIKLRGAIEFAQAYNLAFARCSGDQQFAFSRKAKGNAHPQERPAEQNARQRGRRSGRRNPAATKAAHRPYGRSF